MSDVSSLFDPQNFADLEVTGAMDTKMVDAEPGRYNMQITDLTIRRITPEDSSKKAFTVFECDCVVAGTERGPSGATVSETTGREQIKARYKGFLDLTETGTLDLGKGKNVALGAIREAVGLNNPAMPFKINMLKGQSFNGELFLRPDEKNPDRRYAEVRNPLPRQ